MRNFNLSFILVIGLSLLNSPLFAQKQAVPDSVWQSVQVTNADAVYERQFSGPNSPVYEGYQYVPFILPARGNPFYPTNEWHAGTVCYNGKIFPHLFLLYDILKDQLVLQSANKLYRILLNPKKVSWFTLDSLRFVNIIAGDSTDKSAPPAGYYEQLVKNGPAHLLVKRKKTVVMPTNPAETRSFSSQNIFYVKMENKYFKVKGKHSLLKVLKDQKKAVRRYLRKQNIYFVHNRETAIRRAVIFYNNLKNNEL